MNKSVEISLNEENLVFCLYIKYNVHITNCASRFLYNLNSNIINDIYHYFFFGISKLWNIIDEQE